MFALLVLLACQCQQPATESGATVHPTGSTAETNSPTADTGLDCPADFSSECEVLDPPSECVDPVSQCSAGGAPLESFRSFLTQLRTNEICHHVYLNICEEVPGAFVFGDATNDTWSVEAFDITSGACLGRLKYGYDGVDEVPGTCLGRTWTGDPALRDCALRADAWLDKTRPICREGIVPPCNPDACIVDFSLSDP